ncbi:unnamed protein product [Pocillopora meandrina]|uniref:Uncharacterized protein n=1 Tax=Pocillopora meandrina TaxID=46732 RepID=A0AAU9XMC2_9CNID|nr:unnamed protein product [Pocillopora meandrina]
MNICTIFKQTMTISTFIIIIYFKTNESPHNLNIALCLISREVVFANCGPSYTSWRSGFANTVTELQLEADEYRSATCTSTMQRWHQPRVEGTTSCLISWKGLFTKHNYIPLHTL